MDDNGNLQISVTNFGPIESAEIDLRPLTVFVGPSNTGKSYLAILIYALHRILNDDADRGFRRTYRYIQRTGFGFLTALNLSEEQIGTLARWIDTSRAQIEKGCHSDRIYVSDSVRNMIQPVIENMGEFGDHINEELSRCFGLDGTRMLIRYGSGDKMGIRLRFPVSENSISPVEYGFTAERGGTNLALSIPDDAPLHINRAGWDRRRTQLMRLRQQLDELNEGEDEQREWIVGELTANIAELVEDSIMSPLNRSVHYLPADRTGVMHAHRVAVGSLIAQAPYAGLQQGDPIPMLSGVLADFLGELVQMGDSQNPMTPFRRRREQRASKLANTLEKKY